MIRIHGTHLCSVFARLLIVLITVLTMTGIPGKAASKPVNKSIPGTVCLAVGQQANMPIIIGEKASERVKKAAATLADVLKRISGATFVVKTGDGSSGIVLGIPSDFAKLPIKPEFTGGAYGREDYLLLSRKGSIVLIGATEMGVEDAVWDLLFRLGFRQFFPGKAWEVVPKLDPVTISVNVQEHPDFAARRIWYNWGNLDYNTPTYNEWCERNRMCSGGRWGFNLSSGHAYGNIIRGIKAAIDAHPEYYALVGGKREANSESKMCLSNPDLRKVIVNWAVEQVKANPQVDSISMEPSDGGGWCECEECKKMGGPSNRALTLANDVAVAINELGLGDKYVGMYAYSFHCAPPTIKVDPHVIVTTTTAFITGGFSLDQIIDGWKAQGATLGIYDYYSVNAWDGNMPGRAWAAHATMLAPAIRRYYQKGARFYDCESGDCWGPCGLGFYIASRAMWDVTIADHVKDVIDDFLTKAFGPAKEPMRKFYQLISVDTSHASGSDLTGRMYRFLGEAKTLAANRPDVLMRIYQLVAYTRFVELNCIANSPKADKDSGNRVLTFTYRLRKTSMVHYYGLWSVSIGQGAALDPKHPLKDETPFSQVELDKILTEGIANNIPVEKGFTPVTFSKNLVSGEKLKLPDVPVGTVPPNSQDHHNYYLWVDNAPADLNLKVMVQCLWNLRPHHVKLFAVKDAENETLVTDSTIVKPDGKTYDVVLQTPSAGLHRVEVIDGGDYTHITWPAGLPVAIPSAEDTPALENQFRGGWTLYCYVPKGTKAVGGWFVGRAGVLRDPDNNVAIDFSKKEDGWFSVPVKPGQDGKLWKFENNGGYRQLMTVPPYLFRSNKDVILPKEVVDKDAK